MITHSKPWLSLYHSNVLTPVIFEEAKRIYAPHGLDLSAWFLCGGAVRSLLCGEPVKDFDFFSFKYQNLIQLRENITSQRIPTATSEFYEKDDYGPSLFHRKARIQFLEKAFLPTINGTDTPQPYEFILYPVTGDDTSPWGILNQFDFFRAQMYLAPSGQVFLTPNCYYAWCSDTPMYNEIHKNTYERVIKYNKSKRMMRQVFEEYRVLQVQ